KRLRRPVERQIVALRPRLELVEAAVRENTGLVGLQHDLQEAIQLRELLRVRRFELRDEAVISLLVVALEILGPLPPELALRGAPDERVAVAHQPEVRRVQLLCFDEDLLAYADLAEVVEQGCVTNLFQLFPRERD